MLRRKIYDKIQCTFKVLTFVLLQQAMMNWYRQMIREFRRATESLCEKYDADGRGM